jgi:hypothetical protein
MTPIDRRGQVAFRNFREANGGDNSYGNRGVGALLLAN